LLAADLHIHPRAQTIKQITAAQDNQRIGLMPHGNAQRRYYFLSLYGK